MALRGVLMSSPDAQSPISCDVLVVGGGSAGVAAAVTAARAGADVVLTERLGFLGGKATSANVGTICGLYHNGPDARARYLNEGLPVEFADKLSAQCGTEPKSNRLGLHFLPYQPFGFRLLCDRLVGASGVRLLLHAAVSAVTADEQIHRITVITRDRSVSVMPTTVIDCSGEALCTTLAGHAILCGGNYQAGAQVFSIEGVREASEESLGIDIIRASHAAVAAGQLAEPFSRTSVIPGSLRQGRVDLKLHLPLPVDDSFNSVTELELVAREAVEDVARTLLSRVEALSGAHLADVAAEVGLRTGRRAVGHCKLTGDHVRNCIKSTDTVARGAWPIEHWGLARKPRLELLPPNDFYDIASGCLASHSIRNLWFAGRHFSADDDAIASARVIGTCLATGAAAASLAVRAMR